MLKPFHHLNCWLRDLGERGGREGGILTFDKLGIYLTYFILYFGSFLCYIINKITVLLIKDFFSRDE